MSKNTATWCNPSPLAVLPRLRFFSHPDNGGYLSIWQTHENFFGRVIGATPASGVEFPDFEAVAKAYGIKATTIRSEADLVHMDALLKEDGPLLLNVVVDPRQEFAPRINRAWTKTASSAPQSLMICTPSCHQPN